MREGMRGKKNRREDKKNESQGQTVFEGATYSPPVLTSYGDIRDLTLAYSGGSGESGAIYTRYG